MGKATILALVGCIAACGDNVCGDAALASHHAYVVDSVNFPRDFAEGAAFGFDLNGDGAADNQLGVILSRIDDGFFESGIQESTADAMARGLLVEPVEVDALDLTTSCDVTVTIGPGAGEVVGDLARGRFTGRFTGVGDDAILAFAFAPDLVTQLPMTDLHVSLSAVTETTVSGTIGGAVASTTVREVLLPALVPRLNAVLERDCAGTDPTANPSCGCVDKSAGQDVRGYLDHAPQDCHITLSDLEASGLIQSLFQADLHDTAVSFGIGFTAVRAQ
jgi:hypothetical protein